MKYFCALAAIAVCAPAALAQVCDVVQDCGALADNKTDAAPAISACARRCSTLTFPPGAVFNAGSLDFSNTTGLTVSFSDGTQIWGSTDPAAYPLQLALPPQGNATQWRALVYARNVTNLTLQGPSSAIIDGNGWPWWANFSAGTLSHQRPKLIEIVDAVGVTIRGLTLRNSPFWTQHVIYASHVVFDGLTVLADRSVGNTDGIDPNSATDVLINNCHVDVGDDAISLKSGPHDVTGELLPTARVLVRNTTILSRNIAIGSACFGGIYDVLFDNVRVGDNNGSSPWAIKFKSHTPNGGVTARVAFHNMQLGVISPNSYQQPHGGSALIAGETYGAGATDADDDDSVDAAVAAHVARSIAAGGPVPAPTLLTNISFVNITVTAAVNAGQLSGTNTSNITGMLFSNVVFHAVNDSAHPWLCGDVSPGSTSVLDPVTPPLPADCGA